MEEIVINQKKIIKGNIKNNENVVTSPIALYNALLALSKITDGETKKQILDILDIKDEDVDYVIEKINNTIINEDLSRLEVAASLWFNNKLDINQSVIDEITSLNNFNAEKVEMGNLTTDRHIQKWLNQKTGNLLKDSAIDIKTKIDTYIELLSTIYLKAAWANPFKKYNTKKKTFHIDSINKTKCDFMSTSLHDDYYVGNKFTAVQLGLHGSCFMNLILPNEGETPESICEDEDVINAINGNYRFIENYYREIKLSLPKFNISNKENLNDKLKRMGIGDVFDQSIADFTPCSNSLEHLYLNQVNQATRLKIDEEGIEGASYVEMMVCLGAALIDIPEVVNFTLDKPFIFSITKNGLILFEGTINNPSE